MLLIQILIVIVLYHLGEKIFIHFFSGKIIDDFLSKSKDRIISASLAVRGMNNKYRLFAISKQLDNIISQTKDIELGDDFAGGYPDRNEAAIVVHI